MSKYCSNCGNEMKDIDNVCTNCGTRAEDIANTTVVVNSTNTGSNGIAIAGFVCALLGVNLVGLILSIIGISNAKKCNGKNKGLAIAGVIISALRIVLTLVIITLLFWVGLVSNVDEVNDYVEDEIEEVTETVKPKTIDTYLPEKRDGKVVVYLFVGEGCPHCKEAKDWFESIKGQYGDKFIIEEYETWYNDENAEYFQEIAKSRGAVTTGVPYIIIGKKTWMGFKQDAYPQEIIAQIEDLYGKDI